MKKMSQINEHLWSGIIKRSETGEMRKENSYMSEIVDYLNKHYEYHPFGGDNKKKIVELPSTAGFLSGIMLCMYEALAGYINIFCYNENDQQKHDAKYVMSFSLRYPEKYDDNTSIDKLNKLANDFNGSVDKKMGSCTSFYMKNDEMIYNFLDEVIELFSIKKSLVKIEP